MPELGLSYLSGKGLSVWVQSTETVRVIRIYPGLSLVQDILFSEKERFS